MVKAVLSTLVLLAAAPTFSTSGGRAPGLNERVLIVGGGPNLTHNQVAIESNVRYVMRMLPDTLPMRVLFADGSSTGKTVYYTDPNGKEAYRAPQITRIDGASRLEAVHFELSSIATADSKAPIFLYFTGHGSPNQASQYTNNQYDLWHGEALTVKDFAASLKQFPRGVPVTLLMVECFSGAFGNALFEDGDPAGVLTDQPLCGFFASVPQRPAAGCTPEVNEAEYKDFTSYFVAALTGTDRVGRTVTGADYNKDGKVGMNEAFAYSLIHDDSIDTPVCTSDVFLRRFVTTADADIFTNKYSDVVKWASVSQRAALEGLSAYLSMTTDDRLAGAFEEFKRVDMGSDKGHEVHLMRFVRLAKSVILGHQLKDNPDREIKRRYTELLKLEAGNPFKG